MVRLTRKLFWLPALMSVAACAGPRVKPATFTGRTVGGADLSTVDGGYYADAIAALNVRDYARALDLLQMARAKKPDDVRVFNAFGVVYDKLGRFDLSARYYAQAKALDPGSVIVARNLAYSARLQQQATAQAWAPTDRAPLVLAARPLHARSEPTPVVAATFVSGADLPQAPLPAPSVWGTASGSQSRPRPWRSVIVLLGRTPPWRALARTFARSDRPRPERVSAIIEPPSTAEGGLT